MMEVIIFNVYFSNWHYGCLHSSTFVKDIKQIKAKVRTQIFPYNLLRHSHNGDISSQLAVHQNTQSELLGFF